VWCRLRMNRQGKVEGRVVVSPTQNWRATRRAEPTGSRNLRTATDASRHDFLATVYFTWRMRGATALRSVLHPMVFPMLRSLVRPGRLEDARASASSNHSAVSSLDLEVSEVFRRASLGSVTPLGVSARDVDESLSPASGSEPSAAGCKFARIAKCCWLPSWQSILRSPRKSWWLL
jgi:hypothetical protein